MILCLHVENIVAVYRQAVKCGGEKPVFVCLVFMLVVAVIQDFQNAWIKKKVFEAVVRFC